MGPGRVELPTSRLSGVRSHQLSYEPLIQPQLCTAKLVSFNWSERRFIAFHFRKSNKKTAAFSCQRFRNLTSGFQGSQSLSLLQVIRTRFKTDCAFQRVLHSPLSASFYFPIGMSSTIFQLFSHRTLFYVPSSPLFTRKPAFSPLRRTFPAPRAQIPFATEITEHTEIVQPQPLYRPQSKPNADAPKAVIRIPQSEIRNPQLNRLILPLVSRHTLAA